MSAVVSAPMKIHVNRIPFEGVHEQAHYEPQTLDIDRPDVHPAQPITVSSFITMAEHELVVQAEIQGQFELVCARCLTQYVAPLATSATLTYPVHPADVVDITDDVRQEILLAYPMIPVCRPDCKGLCRRCGQNLNDQACACAPSSV